MIKQRTKKNIRFGVGVYVNMGIGLVFILAAIFIVHHVNKYNRQQALKEAEIKSKLILDRNLAIHTYFSHNLKPELFDLTEPFLSADYFAPSWMSSTYAVRKIDEYFKTMATEKYYYKECAINARSPDNEADEFERSFIEELNSNPQLQYRSMVRRFDDQSYFVTIRRGEVMNDSCLRCHSTPKAAPKGLIDVYGPERSFKRKSGDVISAISIRVPLSIAYANADHLSKQLSGVLLLVLLSIFAVQYLVFKTIITAPLKKIRDKAIQISKDDKHLGEEIPDTAGRELHELGMAFNSMSQRVRQTIDHLEESVNKRTVELSRTNEQLTEEIKERDQTKMSLQKSEERFRLLYDKMPLSYQSLDSNGHILEVNKTWLDMLGYSREEVIGRSFGDFLLPDWKEHFNYNFLRFKEKGEILGLEFEMVKKDGSVILASDSGKIDYDDQGNFKQTHCVLIDITEIKQAEEEKNRYHIGLKKIDQWVKNLIAFKGNETPFYQVVCDGIIDLLDADIVMLPLIDASGKTFTYHGAAGDKAEMILGKTMPLQNGGLCGWVAKNDIPVCVANLADDPRVIQELADALDVTTGILSPLRSGKKIIGGLSAFRKGKPFETVDEQLLTLYSQRVGAIYDNLLLLINLEEKVDQRTTELQKSNKQLLHAEKLSAVGKLSASIAHEFNNPLYGVMNVLNGIKRRAALDAENVEMVDMAISECNRMKHLIKDLQDFNRPTSGFFAPMDIHAAINSMLLLTKKDFKNRKITTKKQYATDLPQIKAVEDQIKQVILNLLNNAADACEGGGTLTITTEIFNKNIVLHIQDTGKGISMKDMDHIFEPFFTTKTAVKGTGLGLPVSYGIIKSHGGDITVKSEADEGTTFTVTLPIEGAQNADK
jgi:hypothetical protein